MNQEVVTWFVCRFPSRDANEGRVMWNLEFPTKEECEMKCAELQKQFPTEHFTADQLLELEEVFERDVAPVIESVNATKH